MRHLLWYRKNVKAQFHKNKLHDLSIRKTANLLMRLRPIDRYINFETLIN